MVGFEITTVTRNLKVVKWKRSEVIMFGKILNKARVEMKVLVMVGVWGI